jgi:CubicO group peptidase (beta-lactamase class C family)
MHEPQASRRGGAARRLPVSLLALALLPATVQALHAVPPPHFFPKPSAEPTVEERVDEIFSDLDAEGSPGAAVVIVRDGKVLFQGAYGEADLKHGTLVTTDTAFHLASVGKQMTAVEVLQLVEKGKLMLDDPVAKFLPELRGWADKVTVRQLLLHTGGLPDVYDALEESGGKPGHQDPDNADALKLLAQWKHLDFAPGSRQEYSNTGYDTLGALIEKVSGQSFGAYLQEHLFTVAGMKDTFTWDLDRRARSKHALGYDWADDRWVIDDASSLNRIHGSGSVSSTVEDMARYDKALFGHRLLRESSLAEMLKPGRLANGQAIPYGFGWEIDRNEENGAAYYGHSGAWMGFSSYYLHYPHAKLSVIVLSNSSETDAESLAFETAEVFLGGPL